MLYSALFIFNIPNMPAASGNCGKGGRVSKMEIPPFPQDSEFLLLAPPYVSRSVVLFIIITVC